MAVTGEVAEDEADAEQRRQETPEQTAARLRQQSRSAQDGVRCPPAGAAPPPTRTHVRQLLTPQNMVLTLLSTSAVRTLLSPSTHSYDQPRQNGMWLPYTVW